MNKNLRTTVAAMLALGVTAVPVSAAVTTSAPAEAAVVMAESAIHVEETVSEVGLISGSVTSDTLSDIILRLKGIIGATDDFTEFDHYYEEYGTYALYELYWRNSPERGQLSVSVGSDGTIFNYNITRPGTVGDLVVPDISKAEAIELALDFTLRLNPHYEGWLSPDYSTVSYNQSGYYIVRMYRHANDLLVGDEYIRVYVTANGEVYRMYATGMTPGIDYPEAEKSADDKVIVDSFADAVPFELRYYVYRPETVFNEDGTVSEDQPKSEVRLHYVPGDYYDTAVDAASGKVYTVKYDDGIEYGAAMGGNGMFAETSAAYDAVAEEEVMLKASLSEAEKGAVELQDTFITVAEAVAAVEAISEFEMDGSVTVARNSLSRNESQFTGKLSYFHNISFTNAQGRSGSATVNAETGEVISFSTGSDLVVYKAVSEHKYSDEECRKTATAFLEANYGEKFKEYRLNENILERTYAAENKISQYSYNYTRYINDIPFNNDTISVTVNPETLGITYFSLYCSDASFPSPNGVISADEAFAAYWEAVDPDAKYVVTSRIEGDTLYLYNGYMPNGTELSLTKVYTMDVHAYVDAFDGTLLRYNGRPYEVSKTEYFSETMFDDIADSKYKTAIEKLADMDIIPAGKTYSPDEAIKAGDFNNMLAYIGGSYIVYDPNGQIVEEFAEDHELTREEGIVMLINALGYDRIAKINGIFKCAFDDADKITAGRLGYAAIAQGLELLGTFGDTLEPTAQLSRGQAAQIVYDYFISQDNVK